MPKYRTSSLSNILLVLLIRFSKAIMIHELNNSSKITGNYPNSFLADFILSLECGMRSFEELLEIFQENSKPSAFDWMPMEFKRQKKYYVYYFTRFLGLLLMLIESIYGAIARDLSLGSYLFFVFTAIFFFKSSSISRKYYLVWLAILSVLTWIGYLYLK